MTTTPRPSAQVAQCERAARGDRVTMSSRDCRKKPSVKQTGRGLPRLPKSELEALVEEATVDAYGDAEQAGGLFTLMEENLRLPFRTEVLGVEVLVEKIDLTEDSDIVVVCRKGRARQRVRVLDLPLPSPPPEGWQWIEAYRYWVRGWR